LTVPRKAYEDFPRRVTDVRPALRSSRKGSDPVTVIEQDRRTRRNMYRLIRNLPPEDVEKVASYAAFLAYQRSLEDAEALREPPLSPEEEDSLAESYEDLKAGRTRSIEEIAKDLADVAG
jgi:hypothetical protein